MPSILGSAAGAILIGLVFLLSTATPPPVNAQEQKRGTLKGRILDAETQEPLPFANVVFFRVTRENPEGVAAGGAMGTAEGTYEAKVEPGTYTVRFLYVGYRMTEVKRLFVSPGQTLVVDGEMPADVIQIEVVEVKAKADRASQGSMLTQIKKAPTVNDAITSAEISRTGDSNAADAMERVTGVSVVGGKYVFVRGLGERYSSTTVNGAAIGSPEANKRVVPLDLFPTDVLDNIVIQKTFSPDMEGEFGGGVVNINTKDYAEGRSFKQSLSLGYTSTDNPFLSYQGGKTDWLGFDDGTRAMPDEIRDIDVRLDRTNFTPDERRELTRSFSNIWNPTSGSTSPNFSYAGVFSQGFRFLDQPAGFLASATLANDYNSILREENQYVGGSPVKLYDANQSSRDVLGGVSASLSVKLSEDTERQDKVKFNFLGTRSSTDLVKVAAGPNFDRLGGDTMTETSLSYMERSLTQSVLLGKHLVGFLPGTFDWSLGYSTAASDEPDRRTYAYEERSGLDAPIVGGGSQWPFQRLYGQSQEYARDLKLDYEIPTPAFQNVKGRFKFGYMYRNKDRSSEYRRFGFDNRTGGNRRVDPTLSPEDLIAPDDSTVNYLVEEITQDNDAWTADQSISAGYFMYDTPTFSWLRLTAGMRYEHNEQDVLAQNPYPVNGQTNPTTIRNRDFGWLPSVNLTWTPGKRTNVRLAYSKTINRPELRELSPFSFYNFTKGWNEQGNGDLKTATLRNYDLRWEYYPGPGEFLSVGAFYKDFDRPIQKTIKSLATGFAEIPVNGEAGELKGLEMEFRVNFMSFWKALDWMADLGDGRGPEELYRWGFVTNYSRIWSNVDVMREGVGLSSKPFVGQSDYSLNVGVFYNGSRFESSLVYKSFGKRLVLFSDSSANKDMTEIPADNLDFIVAYKVSPVTRVKLSAKNLLDEQTLFVQDGGLVNLAYQDGRSISVGISYTP